MGRQLVRNSLTYLHFNFDNSFARSLEGCFVPWKAEAAPAPRLVQLNERLAEELGLDSAALSSAQGVKMLTGNELPEGAEPLAQAYAGHQFGGFSPQLGDGRALLLGEVIDRNGNRRDIHLKGSGRTPFSRGGDGKAALGPVLREYLIGEAMHALGIPTTRALAAVTTGETVYRETELPGAVLARVAASHIRVGTFQFLAARGDLERLKRLADYSIARHFPHCQEASNRYLALFQSVLTAQAALIAQWMSVGFIHGVMNTDNMTISGETIDYGPCAFMDAYSPATVFSSIDTYGRYAYGNQPAIAQWNLARLAETLVPLVDPDADRAVEMLTEALRKFADLYRDHWLARMRAKIGLTTKEEGDEELMTQLLAAMEAAGADFTLVFRRLSDAVRHGPSRVRALFSNPAQFDDWEKNWRARLGRESLDPELRACNMDAVNPIYIPRNHKVEEAISAAVERNDMTVFSNLLTVITNPYKEKPGWEAFSEPAPLGPIPYRTFCGT